MELTRDTTIYLIDIKDERVQIILWDSVRSPMLIVFLGIIGFIGSASKGAIIHYVVRLAPKKRPINTLILLDQALTLLTSKIFGPLIIISLTTGTTLYEIIGSGGCHVFGLAITAHNCSLAIMGCVMALFRVMVIKWEVQGQAANRMLSKLIVVTLVFMLAMITIIDFNHQLHGTGLSLEFCRGHSLTMDEAIEDISQDQSTSFHMLIYCMIFLLQMFVGVELLLYIFLFHHLQKHNQHLKRTKVLPTREIIERHHKNLMTMSGQASTFVLETIFSALVLSLNFRSIGIVEPAIHPLCVMVLGSLISVSHAWSSPELRRHHKFKC